MRDDLHKGAPVPSRYRSLIKECTRSEEPAADETRHFAERAVIGEFSSELSTRFLRKMLDLANAPQQLLATNWASDLSPGIDRSGFEDRVVAHLARIASTDGLSGASLVRALRDTIRERVAANVRAFDGHLAAKCPRQRQQAMALLRSALACVDIEAHAVAIAKGEMPRMPKRRPVGPRSADEDLR